MEKVQSTELVFYTCFFGNNENWANLIPDVPSEKYNCFYFTNNIDTWKRVSTTKWKPIFIDVPIKNNNTQSAFDSKHLKSCPHLYEMLNVYDYICYFDSKHNVNVDLIERWVLFLKHSPFSIILPKHPCHFKSVWEEFNLSMTIDKYSEEKDKCLAYIEKQLNNNFKEKVNHHLTTQFIIRKNNNTTQELNEMWYEHIKEGGIMCQISFFFVQQMYENIIFPIQYQDCYSYCFSV